MADKKRETTVWSFRELEKELTSLDKVIQFYHDPHGPLFPVNGEDFDDEHFSFISYHIPPAIRPLSVIDLSHMIELTKHPCWPIQERMALFPFIGKCDSASCSQCLRIAKLATLPLPHSPFKCKQCKSIIDELGDFISEAFHPMNFPEGIVSTNNDDIKAANIFATMQMMNQGRMKSVKENRDPLFYHPSRLVHSPLLQSDYLKEISVSYLDKVKYDKKKSIMEVIVPHDLQTLVVDFTASSSSSSSASSSSTVIIDKEQIPKRKIRRNTDAYDPLMNSPDYKKIIADIKEKEEKDWITFPPAILKRQKRKRKLVQFTDGKQEEISPNQEGNQHYCPKCKSDVLNCEHDELVKVVDAAKNKKRKLKSILVSPEVVCEGKAKTSIQEERKAAMEKYSLFVPPGELTLREYILVNSLLDISSKFPDMQKHPDFETERGEIDKELLMCDEVIDLSALC